jgi:hypothetical protein
MTVELSEIWKYRFPIQRALDGYFAEICAFSRHFLAISCHFLHTFLIFGEVGQLKCTDEANPIHGGVQMPILQLLQAVHLPES